MLLDYTCYCCHISFLQRSGSGIEHLEPILNLTRDSIPCANECKMHALGENIKMSCMFVFIFDFIESIWYVLQYKTITSFDFFFASC